MSNCIKDLYDYDLVKNCLKCGIASLKSNFHKNKNKIDGLNTYCKSCINQKQKQYDIKNRDKKREYYKDNRDRIKEYQLRNHDKIIARKRIYSNNKYKSDINFRIISNTRRKIHHALNGKSISSLTTDILGIDINLYRKWIEFQFTPEMKWENIEIDHVKPICLFDISDDEQLKEAFNWMNTQPLLKKDHQLKGTKFNFLDYQLQFIKAYQFLNLNERGSN